MRPVFEAGIYARTRGGEIHFRYERHPVTRHLILVCDACGWRGMNLHDHVEDHGGWRHELGRLGDPLVDP